MKHLTSLYEVQPVGQEETNEDQEDIKSTSRRQDMCPGTIEHCLPFMMAKLAVRAVYPLVCKYVSVFVYTHMRSDLLWSNSQVWRLIDCAIQITVEE